ncbi:MAG: AraC family transcriptional regulator [Deltaproteobacteria bacterium]
MVPDELHVPNGSPSAPDFATRALGRVLTAADELAGIADTDLMLRRAVELARERIGLERVGLCVRDPRAKQQLLLRGTWGTGLRGETTDEHYVAYEGDPVEAQMFCNLQREGTLWRRSESMLQCPRGVGGATDIGRGWLVATPLVAARELIGVMYNDAAASRAHFDERKQLVLAVFCSLLAGLFLPRRSRYRWPATASSQQGPRVKSVLRALEENPRSTGGTLARQLSISPGHLARSFKAEVGVSLVEYRHRRLMDRFFVTLERGNGNLLAAALEAGFGSYTQFHRVYKRMFGTSPREQHGAPSVTALHGKLDVPESDAAQRPDS